MIRMGVPDDMKDTIGRRIADTRKNRMMEKAELADKISVKPATISMYENGRRTPSVRSVISLARALGISTDYLLLGKDGQIIDGTRLNENDLGLCQ